MACAFDAWTPHDASRDESRDDVVTIEIPTASGARQIDTLEVTQARYAELAYLRLQPYMPWPTDLIERAARRPTARV